MAFPRATAARHVRAARVDALRIHLDGLLPRFGRAQLERDPVWHVHRFRTAADREVAALLSAVLAFGRVEVILRNLGVLFERLGPRPAAALDLLDAAGLRAVGRDFRHRWVGPREVVALLRSAQRLRRECGTFEAAFQAGDDPAAPTVEPGLRAFSARALAATGAPGDRAMRFLFPSPDRGGACKRLNLFLRWVVRPADGIDLGLWRSVAPSRLLIPLDVHLAFHARILGLSRRRVADWKMVQEVTAALSAIDPEDPVRYDFPLCHLGMHGDCKKRRDPLICPTCPIDPVCGLPWRTPR
jgi:uncharacterized protein (TIGR02757 family)